MFKAIESRIWLLPTVAFICAFFIRSYLVVVSSVITPDGILYIKSAQLFEIGEWNKVSDLFFINLYPFFILLFHKIIPDWEIAGRMVSVIMGSLTAIPFFLMIKGMFDVRTAMVSSLFYIINPRLADYSADVLREPTFWFFSVTALWLAWEGISRVSLIWIIFSSFSTGLAIFTRIEGVSVFVLIILWIIWHFWKIKPNTKKLFLFLFVFVFTIPVLLSPFLLILKYKLGRWEFSHAMIKIPALLMNVNADALEMPPNLIQTMPLKLSIFLELAKSHKYVIFFSDILLKLVKSANIVFIFFAIIGVIRKRKLNDYKNEVLVAIWFGVFFIIAFAYITKVYYFSTRHGLLMGIPVLIWAGIGFFEIKEWIYLWFKRTRHPGFLVKNVTTILIIAILIAIMPKTLSPGGYDKIEMKKAGTYFKNMGYKGIIFTGEPGLQRIAFYADSEFSPLPVVETTEELMKFMRENKTELLIFDKNTSNSIYKNIQSKIDDSVFEQVSLPEFEKYREYKILAYRLKNKL
jgi:hypothetical protein